MDGTMMHSPVRSLAYIQKEKNLGDVKRQPYEPVAVSPQRKRQKMKVRQNHIKKIRMPLRTNKLASGLWMDDYSKKECAYWTELHYV